MSTEGPTRVAPDPPPGLEELAKLTRSLVEAHERPEMSAETPAERRHLCFLVGVASGLELAVELSQSP